MLFCSTMFGQNKPVHWTVNGSQYNNSMTMYVLVELDGTEQARGDIELGAFCDGVLRGVSCPIKAIDANGNERYLYNLLIHGSNSGDVIRFKIFVPGIGDVDDMVYDSDYTVSFVPGTEIWGDDVNYEPLSINFYEKKWTVDHDYDMTMTVGSTIRIDGVDPKRTDLELAAFCGDEVRGVAKAIYWQSQDMYYYELTVGGRSNGEEITYKLYDPIANVDLLTDYKTIFEQDATIDDGNGKPVTIEFKNNPVAMITNATGNHYFSSLEAAVAAAQPGETIKLLQDVTLEETLTIEKSITIDGDGFEIKPAVATKTYDSAIMVGNSGWGDDHGEVITLNNIKLNNWKTNFGVVRAQGVTLNMTACEFNGNEVTDVANGAYGVLSLNFTDATVTNSIFKQNTDRAIDINFNGDDSNAVVTIDGCTFEENASEGAGIVVRNDGTQLVVKNSKFLNNTVTTSGNAAVLYAGWGTNDEIKGCYFYGNNVTTSHATTKRFASAIFCDGCTVTGNAFANNTATRNGEAITTTVAVGAFYGAANISENYWGGNAPVPGEDYTVEYTNNNVAVNDYYEEYSEGTLSNKVTLNNVAKAGKYYYESITAAFAAVQDGETVTMLHDVSLSESIKVNNNITLDLNGKTITGTDNNTPSFALIEIQPGKELVVNDATGNGKITLTATNNRGWNAYSSVISNQRGKLTVNGGTIEHLGGTDMAYGIDNLTNGKGTYAETIINGGTVKSLYRAIRQFLNGIEAQNILTVNGGTIEGANKSIWMQSANANANPGKLTIVEGVTVKGNILLEAEPNATSWPVEVSIVASTLKDGAQVMTEDLPSGYELVLENGVYRVYHGVAKIGNNYYDDLSSALKAITSGCTLDILTDITIASDWDCRNTGAKITVPVTINGNGKTIKFTGKIYDANWNTLFRFEDVATVKNLTLDASAATDIQRGITFKTSVTVDNCTLIGNGGSARYAVIVGEGAGAEYIGNVTANITNSTFKNWKNGVTDNMNGQDMKEFAITGCTFDNTDVIISAYEKVTFTGNNMSSNSYVNITSNTVPNNVQVVANNNTNLAANTETECNQIAAPLANINAQDGFLKPVAEAGGQYYVTLQGAVDGVADSGTITLLSDIELAAQDAQELFKPAYNRESYCGVYIPDDKTVVLELNGKTVSYLDTKDDVDNVMVMNLGNLTINDNSAENTGKITYKPVAGSSQYAKFYSTIFNCGTLTVNAGTIENTAEAETDVTNAVDNHSRLSHEYDNNSILIVNGGTLSGAYYYAIRQYTHYFEGVQNRVVINDGNINGGIYMQHGDSWYYANAESNRLNVDCYLEIKGGNINVNTTSDAFGKIKSRLFNPDNNAFGLNISGGIINVPVELLVQRGVYYENGVSGATVPAETPGTRNAEWLAKNDGFVQGGTFSQIGGEEEHTTNLELFLKKGYKLEANTDGTYGVVVDPDYGMVAKIGETRYATLAAAFADAAQTEELTTIELLPVTIEEDDDINTPEKTIKLPATIKNVIVKGADNNTSILKNLTIQDAQGGTYDMSNITFDGVVFDNSNIVLTGWRTGFESLKNLIVKNCIFSNIVRSPTNLAAVHINVAADKAVNGFTFINNVIDGVTGAQNSGIYGQFTGEVIVKDNVINNVAFRPYVIQLTTDDGIADEFTVTGNTFSGSAAGRAQGLGNNAEGTDAVKLTVSENIFKGITNAQQICYWNFNEATTTAKLEKNYYDIDVLENPNRIYYNGPAQDISELSEMGIFPIYTELNADGTINEESLFDPVAYVGTKAFETLDEAVAEVTENNNTIVVIANVENVNHLIIPAGKNVVLDLNGKTISGVCNTSSEHNADLIEVENTATLTIKDSSENEEGKVSYASGTYKTGFTVDVKGNLILESGTIELTDSWSLGFAVDVRPNAWGTAYTEASTFVMNGGKVVSSDTGVRIDSNSGETNPSSRHGVYFTMNGGDIISDWDAIFIQHRYANDLYVNIAENAGTIQGKNSPLRIYGDGVVSDVEINIAGGTFDYTGDEGTTGWVVEKFLKATEAQVEAAKIEITGGTFDADVSRFCAFNYVCTSNGDGTYGIEYKQQENNAFVISTLHELEAFRDAVNAGNTFKDQTVVLSAGVDLNPTRAINNWEPIGTQANPFEGTFDGGDNTISNLVVEGENYLGLFGKTDGATIKNVKINNVTINGVSYLGAIVGMGYTGTIDNCHVTGYVEIAGNYMVGGINGQGYATVNNSSVVANDNSFVKAIHDDNNNEGDNVGGIVGHCGETNTLTANTVKNITISGTRKVGGIVGIANQGTKVENCVVEDVTIETSATEAYANDNITTMSIGALIGQYQNNGSAGTVKDCMVKNVEFNNVLDVNVSVGPITGGSRGGTGGMLAPTGVTASGNLVYMSTITGSTNTYLMNAVAKIDETEYYTLFDAVAAAQGETTITMLRNTAEEFAIDNTTANITLDMAGNTLTGAITPSKANLTIENGTINNENASYSAIEINAGTLVLNNDVKVTSKRHGVRIDGAVTATINGGEYTLTATSGTRHAVNVSGGAEVTIKAGTFVGPAGTTMDSGSAVCVQAGATVTIEGGDFSKGKNATLGVSGTMIVKGGTFDQDPSAYLADAYTVNIENEMYVVRYTPIMVTYPVGNPVYPEGKVEYYSDMLEAVPYTTNCPRLEGAIITLLADVSGAGMRFMENDMVFDLNGHTYTITAGTGSQGTNTSGFQIRPEVTTNVLFKDGTIKVAEGAPVVWMFNCYATDFIVENVTVDCSNMAYSYGDQVYVVVSREGDNVQLTGETKIVNFNSDVAGNAINVGGTMTIGEEVDLGVNAVIKLGGGAQLTAPAGLNVVTVDGYMVVYENGVYKSVKVVAQVGDVKYESVAAAMTAAKEAGVKDLEITIIGENTQDTDDSFNLIYATAFDNVTIKQNNGNKPFYIESIYTGDRTSTDGKFVFDGVNMIITEQIWFECDVVLTNNSSVKRSNDVKNFIYYGEVTVEPGSKYISQIDDVYAGSFTVDGGKTDGTYNEAEDFKTVFFDVRDGHTFTAKNGANILISSGEGGKLSLMGNANIDASKVYVYNEIALGDNGKFALDIESSVTTKNVTGKGVISVDALNINEGVVYNVITANMSSFAGIIEINNDDAEYEITSTGLVVKMKPFVAQVEDEQFTSLQAAIDAADGKTVVVLDNITLTETVTVAAGTTVTLDLNGKTISAGDTFAAKAIRNDGVLTINGNGGTIDISASTTESIQVVDNYGTLTINGGTYKGATSNYSYAIRANDANSVTNIVDATITTHFGAIGINKGVTTITDGKFEVTSQAGGHALYVANAEVTINGGEFIPYANGYSYAVLTNDANAKVSITGGTFKKGLGDPCVKALSGNFIITGGTFSTDVDDEYCHEYYDAIQGDDNLWRVEQVLFAQTTSLQGGWNWFSSYVDIDGATGLSLIQSALGSNGVQIKNPETGRFSQYSVNPNTLEAIWSGSLRETSSSDIYAIRTLGGEEITHNIEIVSAKLDPADPSNTVTIRRGWNYVAYPLDVQLSVNAALGFTPTMGDVIKSKDQSSIYFGTTWVGQLTNMIPGQGYMYQSNNSSIMEFNFEYPSTNNRESTVLNIEAIDYYWNVDAHNYSGNMTMIAMLETNDEIMQDGYEIAAFANGECRGTARPVYVESVDAYILVFTVNGEDVEELSFKCYDVNTGVEYNLNNRINYSNDAVVGSIDEPYMFNLDMLNIGETSVENISIYPNPTTTGSEINLQAVCDKVEVFNALGVKVAEYTNVDSIDAIETAGVYVIRLTIDNSARNCRLIVK